MTRYLIVLLLAALAAPPARAQATREIAPADPLCADLPSIDPFRAGACSLQFMAGYYPMTSWGPGGPQLDYVPLAGRLGYVVKGPNPDRCLKGVGEVFLEYLAAPITRTFGSYLTGPSLLLRYTHYDAACLVQPYIQAGAGVVFTDANRGPVYQNLIGQSTEFLLQAALGARLMVTECFSLDLEGGFQHISNAGIAARNGGINNVGFSVGVTYSFSRP